MPSEHLTEEQLQELRHLMLYEQSLGKVSPFLVSKILPLLSMADSLATVEDERDEHKALYEHLQEMLTRNGVTDTLSVALPKLISDRDRLREALKSISFQASSIDKENSFHAALIVLSEIVKESSTALPPQPTTEIKEKG